VTYFSRTQIKNELFEPHFWVAGAARFGILRTRFTNKKQNFGLRAQPALDAQR
jgi:hypothetical protein